MKKNERILIVEDEVLIATDISYALKELGYAAVGIRSRGEDALTAVRELNPDLVLLDIMLRGEMDGIETGGKIRDLFRVPFIYVTAHSDEATLGRAKLTGPLGYLVKPFNESDLYSAIETALHNHREQLRLVASEKWLTEVLRSMGQGLIAVDALGTIQFLNPAAEAITGWSPVEAVGFDIAEVYSIKASDAGATESLLAETMAADGARSIRGVVRITDRSGAEREVEQTASVVTNERGQMLGFVLLLHEVVDPRPAGESQ